MEYDKLKYSSHEIFDFPVVDRVIIPNFIRFTCCDIVKHI